jgi:hypothetical protein
MLECPGCRRRQRMMQQLGDMYDAERAQRQMAEERFTRLKHEADTCQCLKRFLEKNSFETFA